jgi:hypothetical protein
MTPIESLHRAYVQLTGLDIRLDMARESDWFLYLKKGFDQDDLRLVIAHLKKGIQSGARNPGALKFRNLIVQLDYFEEDLAQARAEARIKKPDRARASILKSSNRGDEIPTKDPVKAGTVLESPAFQKFVNLKNTLSLFAFFAFFAVNSHAALLQWDTVPDASGYKLYCGDQSHIYTNTISVGRWDQTTNTLTLPPGHYYFSLTATNGLGEGPYSDEVTCTFTNPVHLVIVSVAIERSDSLSALGRGFGQVLSVFSLTNAVPATNTNANFYRAKMQVQTQ